MLGNETEHQFVVKGLTLKTKSWGDPNHKPVLAIHGWLDNCHSFKPMAKYLDDIYLVAIDLAGNGRSDYRSKDAGYNIWQDVGDIFAIADQLGFETFTLMGHSRGALVCTLCAGTFPERINGVLFLDGFAPPEFHEPADVPKLLAQSIKTNKRFSQHKRKLHPSIDAAVDERTRRKTISKNVVEILAERGMNSVDGGVVWSSDPRLQAASEYRFNKEQCQAFADQVECPCLLILADDYFSAHTKQAYLDLVGENPLYSYVEINAKHHLHMEDDSIEEVAGLAQQFLKSLK